MNSGVTDGAQPFFSIVIPTYNGEATIDHCLASIIIQEFQCYEVLIIDSFSKDTTVEKVNSYAEAHKMIKLFSVKSGIYEAMNYGVSVSTGRYLYFMGCDDVLFSKYVLSDVFAAIQDSGSPHIIYGNVLLGEKTRLYDGSFNLSKLYQWNICHQSVFYSKPVFDIVGLYDESFSVHADWHFNFRCFATKELTIKYISNLIAVYATNGFSSSSVDDLDQKRREIFMPIARRAELKEYLRMKIDATKTTGIQSKIQYVYYVLLFGAVSVLRRMIK